MTEESLMRTEIQAEIYQLDDLSYAVHLRRPVKNPLGISPNRKRYQLYYTKRFETHKKALNFAKKEGEISYRWYGHKPLKI
jgi:hypothetical protein